MATLKITQIKSRIGATAKQCANLDALGLHRINHTVSHSDSAIILGMLNKVKHLVKVEVVEEKAPAKKAVKAEAPAKFETKVLSVDEKTGMVEAVAYIPEQFSGAVYQLFAGGREHAGDECVFREIDAAKNLPAEGLQKPGG